MFKTIEITCKLCDVQTIPVRVKYFVAHICPECRREIGVRGFPLDANMTVKNALTRRIDPAAIYEVNELITHHSAD